MRSLYAHFPFCEAKCHYCDFYSLGRERTRTDDPGRFQKALKAEAERVSPKLAPQLDTIFFGGGTPSLTSAEEMRQALEPLKLSTRVAAETEWTMEANPSSITPEGMRAYRALGVNRVSMGVQAMKPELLTMLGRVHSREAVFQALDAVFSAGFDNVSVDLLCGVPGQTTQNIQEALEELTRFPITHLSCYLLTLPPHHRMHKDLPNEETQLEHLLFLDRWMREHGFEHYEISNFAKPGKKARHNLNYWKGESYLGLGPSAHSFDAKTSKRWKNVSSLHRYADLLLNGKSPVEWTEVLTTKQRDLEKWMLALRLDEGFPKDWLSTPLQRARSEAFLTSGLLEKHPSVPDRMRLTARGFALSDQVIAALS